MVFSVDGGTTWSANVTAAPGQTVIAREYFNNDTSANIAGAQVTTTLPSGFVLQGGTTRVCLNPGTTDPTNPTSELECNTNTGGAAPNDQGGPINESSVWSGTNLTISPSAGLFGQPTNAISGILAAGKVKFINLEECSYQNTTTVYVNTVHPSNDGGAFDSGTNAGNTASTLSCGPGNGVFTQNGQTTNEGVLNVGLLGQADFNLNQCEYNGVNTYTDFVHTTNSGGAFNAGTNASNSSQTTVSCGARAGVYVPEPTNSGVAALDVLDNRYVNLDQCEYNSGASAYTTMVDTSNSGGAFDTGTAATNAPQTTDTCGPGVGTWTLIPANSGVLALDTLDTTRGQGFVQWSMTAPSPATTTVYTEDGQLTGSGTGDPTTSGTITIDASVGTPLANPLVIGGVAAGLGLVTAAIVFARRRSAAA
jgi:hypothetical protein